MIIGSNTSLSDDCSGAVRSREGSQNLKNSLLGANELLNIVGESFECIMQLF